jgi:regulator of replication initiation timing
MDDNRRRQLLEKGRQSLQKHREAKAQSGEQTPASHNSTAHTPSTPVSIENGGVFRSPSSPIQISPIPLVNLASPLNGASHSVPSDTLNLNGGLSHPVPASKSTRETELEAKLAMASASLVAAQAENQHLKSENQALRSTSMQLESERDQLKRQFEELVKTSQETLISQQTALNKAHTGELAHIRAQLNQAQLESVATIDQLKRDKAEMQGMVHLLQQQLSAFSSTASSDNVLLEQEKAHSARLSSQLHELSMQLEAANSTTSQKLESQSQVHKGQLEELKRQQDNLVATLKLDHASELQQLRTQLHNPQVSIPAVSEPSPSAEAHHAELESVRKALKDHKERLSEAESKVKGLQDEIEEQTKIIADLDSKLKKSSEHSKTIQSQTNANFAQLEQMKQQVLRDRADLSKKLSLIAPETIRRVEQLQHERESINAQFSEMAKSLTELAQQKNDILNKLAAEVSRNAALVHQNAQLRHELSLQLSAMREPQKIIPAPETSIPDEVLDDAKLAAMSSSDDKIDADSILVEISKPSDLKEVERKKSQRAKLGRRKTRPLASPKHSETENPTTKANGSDHTSHANDGRPNSQTGWLSSMPLVGRLWRGQPPVRHTAQVEL